VRLVSSWAAGVLALSLVCGCEERPAFSVPPGPPKLIAVEAYLPVYVPGNWATSSFKDALRVELAKYRLKIVDAEPEPVVATFQIELGQFTYRQWQTIDVNFVVEGGATRIGRIRVPDLETTTLEAAAQPVATIIARRVWRAEVPDR
jgi:hypothetical protein